MRPSPRRKHRLVGSALKGQLIASPDYDSSKPVMLRFDLTNNGDIDLYVLKWFTPLEGLNSDCLKVIRNKRTKVLVTMALW